MTSDDVWKVMYINIYTSIWVGNICFCFWKEVSYAYQGYIYMIKKHSKYNLKKIKY